MGSKWAGECQLPCTKRIEGFESAMLHREGISISRKSPEQQRYGGLGSVYKHLQAFPVLTVAATTIRGIWTDGHGDLNLISQSGQCSEG